MDDQGMLIESGGLMTRTLLRGATVIDGKGAGAAVAGVRVLGDRERQPVTV